MAEFRIDVSGCIESWTICGESKHNVLSLAMVRELASHVARIAHNNEIRVVILSGAGDKAFCAGADLKERAGMDVQEVTSFLQTMRNTFRALESAECVFIAYINGLAFGGGVELSLCCDIRVMRPASVLGMTEVRWGIIPGAGGTQRLPRLIGHSAAKELILTGRRVGADEAMRLGLVQRIGSMDDAMDIARSICANAPIAVKAAKQAIDAGAHLQLDAALDLEQRAYERTLGTEDRLEGLKAFQEKRPPVFRGR